MSCRVARVVVWYAGFIMYTYHYSATARSEPQPQVVRHLRASLRQHPATDTSHCNVTGATEAKFLSLVCHTDH